MDSEHANSNIGGPISDQAWDVFLPDGEADPEPDEGDFWFETWDDD